MEQFSLEGYLKNPSRKVITRNGRNVRIICTDKKGFDYPIVALIENKLEGLEGVLNYTKDGEYTANRLSNSDLFFAPEKHEGWINIFNDGDIREGGIIYDSKEEAEKWAKINKLCVATIKVVWEE